MNELNRAELLQIAEKLQTLRVEMIELESSLLADQKSIHKDHRQSARNLAHYLALRRNDNREVQTRLAALGLSSLGRTEGHVMDTVQAVLKILGDLTSAGESPALAQEPVVTIGEGTRLLERNTEVLLGPAPPDRRVRIMVTMSTDAATNDSLVRDLLVHGMNCMRINCAHDNEEIWSGMIRNLQKAREETHKDCRILMDLAGPKLRTGPIRPGSAVIKVRPKRDELGRVVTPARILLAVAEKNGAPARAADARLPVPSAFLSRLRQGDTVVFQDARAARRSMKVISAAKNTCLCELSRTAYFIPDTEFRVRRAGKGNAPRLSAIRARLGPLPKKVQTLLLKQGDTLILSRSPEAGVPAKVNKNNRVVTPARIGVTLPEFFDHVKPGEPVWFDDGKIGGTVRSVNADGLAVEITQARPEGGKLGADKGINLPESDLRVPALTAADRKALQFIVKHADLVGYSFVRTESDVRQLLGLLSELGGESLGVVLKIETRKGFDNLPRLILTAMRTRAVGVMIARGDLAVECGYQRLAEIQEEILWVCEAAHVPVIWATQVLENLAKTGMPSRSEITDAAMGERAECVMLNKGPYDVNAVAILDDILKRMQAHQEKKLSILRRLGLASSFANAD
ncbi:MAG: pyruvate kinase [Candidatus Acidiferrales bacterium]